MAVMRNDFIILYKFLAPTLPLKV